MKTFNEEDLKAIDGIAEETTSVLSEAYQYLREENKRLEDKIFGLNLQIIHQPQKAGSDL